MPTFEEIISPYPNVLRTYTDALAAGKNAKLKDEDLAYFISKNCRAYFFHNYLRVEREASDQEDRGIDDAAIVPFLLTDIQLGILDAFERRFELRKKFRQRIMKCRRAQVSTIYLAIGYHIVRFNENKKGLCFTDKIETSKKLMRIMNIFYSGDALDRKPVEGQRTGGEGMYLHHGSSKTVKDTSRDSFVVIGSAEQKNTGLAGGLDFFHWSECSLSPNQLTHWTTISPSLKGALFEVAESTPSLSGQDDIIFPDFDKPKDFCDAKFISWMDVKEYRVDDKKKVDEFVPYVEHHLYGKEGEILAQFEPSVEQMLWRRLKLDEINSLNAFRQMFPISIEEAFYSSVSIVFNREMIALTKEEKTEDLGRHTFADQGIHVSCIKDDGGVWNLFEKPQHNEEYLITCDPSEGRYSDRDQRDKDYHVAMIFKLGRPVKEVAIFRDGRFPVETFAEQVAVAARFYNNAHVMPEMNNSGLAFIVRLMQHYSNIYRHQSLQGATFSMSTEYGFRTTSPSKSHAVNCLMDMIRKSELIIRSEIVRKEMSKFEQIGVRYQAMSGHHDDTITALWLMAVCLFQTPHMIKTPSFSGGQFNAPVQCIEPKIERDEWAFSS